MRTLGFHILREANLSRLPEFRNSKGELSHPSDSEPWTPSQWLQAAVGEFGEYANVRKKFERGDLTEEQFKQEASHELADIIIYLDLLAFHLGIDLAKAVIEKFNIVSKRVGAETFIEFDGNHWIKIRLEDQL